MKKIVARVIIISAISLGCNADLFGKFVQVTIDNQSEIDEVRVKGKDGGDTFVGDKKSENEKFILRKQPDGTYKTTLKISSVNESTNLGTSVEITGATPRLLIIKQGLKPELRNADAGPGKSKKRRRVQQDEDQDRPNKRRRTHLEQ